MHPLLLKFLTPESARAAAAKARAGEPLDADERTFTETLQRFPEYAEALEQNQRSPAPPELQSMLLLIGSSAAARQLADHPRLEAATAAARAALRSEGASEEEGDSLLSVILLEEALASEEEPETFDEAWVQETLETVPALAQLTEEKVGKLLDEADEKEGAPGRAAAAMLLQTAWEDGPQPVTVEHLEEAAQGLADLPKRQRSEAIRGLEAVIAALAAKGLIGPLRRGRLERALPRREG